MPLRFTVARPSYTSICTLGSSWALISHLCGAVQVGLLETREQAERKSGVEAWSLRLHSSLNELGFNDFVSRFEGEDIPFHRIAFFKQNGVVVW